MSKLSEKVREMIEAASADDGASMLERYAKEIGMPTDQALADVHFLMGYCIGRFVGAGVKPDDLGTYVALSARHIVG